MYLPFLFFLFFSSFVLLVSFQVRGHRRSRRKDRRFWVVFFVCLSFFFFLFFFLVFFVTERDESRLDVLRVKPQHRSSGADGASPHGRQTLRTLLLASSSSFSLFHCGPCLFFFFSWRTEEVSKAGPHPHRCFFLPSLPLSSLSLAALLSVSASDRLVFPVSRRRSIETPSLRRPGGVESTDR